ENQIKELVPSAKITSKVQNVFNGFAVSNISENEVNQLEFLPEVKKVYPNFEVHTFLMDSVPLINADDVWQLQDDLGNYITGEGITIGIIDTGVDYTHPDLGGCFGQGCKVEGGWDFINNDSDPIDDAFHGTHVAATAAGKGVLDGVAPDATIYAYKVLNSGGSGSWGTVLGGIERAVDPNQDGDFSDHLDIISMSLGANCWGYTEDCGPDDVVSQAVDNAVNLGVVAVISAGNSGPGSSSIGSPGTARKAITVGATYKKDYEGQWHDLDPRVDQITVFSSRGPVIWEGGALVKPDVVAPGAYICAARYDSVFPVGEHSYYYPCLDEEHVQLAGTSMSAPMVSGVVALVKQAHPDWNPEEIKSALKSSTVNLLDPNIGESYSVIAQGAGRVDAQKTVLLENPIVAEITSNATISGTNIFNVMGNIQGDYDSYSLFYKSYDDWTEICSSTSISNGILCEWDVRFLPEDLYYLKLIAKRVDLNAVDYSVINIKNTDIYSPINLSNFDRFSNSVDQVILRSDEVIEIKGTASGYNFEYYNLLLCSYPPHSEDDCTADGISLVNNGQSPIVNGVLGYLNPASLSSGFYYILLKNKYNGSESIKLNKIYVETDLQDGWPKMYDETFVSFWLDQPTISDMDKDGSNDIITNYGQTIDMLNSEGVSLPNWPVEISTTCGRNAIMQFGSAVADLDKDGFNEIVVGDNCGYLHVLNHDASYVFDPIDYGSVVGVPTIEDIDNDGNLDIVWSDWWSDLRAVNSEGEYLDGFPVYLIPLEGYPYFNKSHGSVSIVDIVGDEKKELIVESRSCNNSSECYPRIGNSKIWIIDSQGNVVNGWPKNFSPGVSTKNLVIADLDNDGEKEILFGDSIGSVYALNADGSNVNGWPISIFNDPTGEFSELISILGLSLGDLDLDGDIEVVFTGSTVFEDTLWGTWLLECLWVLNSDGSIFNDFPVCGDYTNFKTSFWGLPILANIDSDPEMEIITPAGGGWYVNNLAANYAVNIDGSIVEGFPKYTDDAGFGTTYAVEDLDNDGDNEFLMGTWRGTTFVYDLSGNSGSDSWPQFQHDAQHTGLYTKSFSVPVVLSPVHDGYITFDEATNSFEVNSN
ncbi:S8 family serine peptidase, partial [Candidatus Micrarchaeota archaeon]|nr:S8 family serine peptidase [Candidatus Micrarchaeota archaeon]